MGLQDGFGDALSAEEIEQHLLANERLLKLKVGDRLRGSDIATDVYADLLQEGRIVQWEVLLKRPDAPAAYVSAAMTNRIKECISRGTWTGMETHRGRPTDPLRRRDRDSVDDESVEIVEEADWLEHVLLAYHYGQISSALSALTFTQRRYVFSRFWLGMSYPEIAAEHGISAKEVERQWRVNIRPALEESLRHLATD